MRPTDAIGSEIGMKELFVNGELPFFKQLWTFFCIDAKRQRTIGREINVGVGNLIIGHLLTQIL